MIGRARMWLIGFALTTAALLPSLLLASPLAEVPRHPLELQALIDPGVVLVEIDRQLSTSRQARERALLFIAKANACRVMANWDCQREAGSAAAEIGAQMRDPVISVRGLIAKARALNAVQDFAQGEQALGEAQLLIEQADPAVPELNADVMLAYSSLSHTLGKHQTAVAYADRGLAVLGELPAPTTRSRLFRNRARALAVQGDIDGARVSLAQASQSAATLKDVKLNAEFSLESARFARLQGDTHVQQAEGVRALALAKKIPNSQIEGLAHEVLGLAALDAGELTIAQTKLRDAYESFGKLGLLRDQLRITRQLMQLALERRADQDTWLNVVRDFLRLDRAVASSDRVKAAEDFETRLKYAQQKFETERLAAEALLSSEREHALSAENRLQAWLIGLSIVIVAVLGFFFLVQRRALDLERVVSLRTHELASTNEQLKESNNELERAHDDLIQSGKRADLIFSALTEALPGQIIDGKYRIDSFIGAGAFGTVYKATHLMLDTAVAIKIFKPVANRNLDESLSRLRTEGASAFRIQHPNAVQVLDLGISMDSLPYMVMELLDGLNLEVILQAGKLPWQRVMPIVGKIADALAAAHRVGVIHRDVKPSNVLMCINSDGYEFPKLLDFGIAKLASGTADPRMRNLTVTGLFMGTPSYMAPERFVSKPYDGKSDVYSLGVLAFELLTGSKPFPGSSDNYLAVAMQHLQQEPPDICELRPDLPVEFGALIHSMLNKDAQARPSAEKLESQISAGLARHGIDDAGYRPNAAPSDAAEMRQPSGTPTLIQARAF